MAASSLKTDAQLVKTIASCLGTDCGVGGSPPIRILSVTTVRLDGEPYEVVGVAPAGFTRRMAAELWAPIALTDQQWADRRNENFGIMGRLSDGATVEQARAELTTIVDGQRRDHPDTNVRRYARLMSFTNGMADPGAGAFIGIWQGAALLLLLIACANIANLLMARGAERSSEYAIRLALGASRARIFTQTLIEGLLLALMALAVSIPLLAIGLGLSRGAIPASVLRFVPGWSFIRIDVTLLLTTALLGTVAMVAFSLLPSIQAVRAQVPQTRCANRDAASRPAVIASGLRSTLAATQIALALALLFASTMSLAAAR
jgi:hypothetical protein